MRGSRDVGAWAVIAILAALPACEVDGCHEEGAVLADAAALSAASLAALDARCTRGEEGDGCPIDDCDASCPVYTIAGGTTQSVEPASCRLDRAATRLSCSYRVIYDVCG